MPERIWSWFYTKTSMFYANKPFKTMVSFPLTAPSILLECFIQMKRTAIVVRIIKKKGNFFEAFKIQRGHCINELTAIVYENLRVFTKFQ